MKKLLALVLTLMLTVTMFAACSNETANDANTNSEAENLEKLVIGYTIYEPMNYMEDGKLTGFDTEFAEAVCEKLNLLKLTGIQSLLHLIPRRLIVYGTE